jgi:hypothetical protein
LRLLTIILVFLFQAFTAFSQSFPFEKNGKWGMRDSALVVIPAKFDTIFGFDPTGKVCLGCFEIKKNASNKFMRVTTVVYACNYLNPSNKTLVIKDGLGDTCSVFSFGKQSVAQYSTTNNIMMVSVKGVRNLVTKDFRQLTYKGYHNIYVSPDPNFYFCEYQSESETIFTGIVDKAEDEIVPYKYSSIRFNTSDSIIVCCSAGLINGSDDLYDYEGHRVFSTNRHIEHATKHFVVQKTFEPQPQYFLLNRVTGDDKLVDADEIKLDNKNEILIRKKTAWFSYNPVTGEKKPFKQY